MASSSNNYVDFYQSALTGNFEKVLEIFVKFPTSEKDLVINLALIGESDQKDRTSEHKKIRQWALENGGCFIFTIDHESITYEKTDFIYNKNISMLKGPGDVSKGTFGGLGFGV